MRLYLSARAAFAGLLLAVFLMPASAWACKDKTDCAGNEICCFSAFGGRNNLTSGGKVVQGYCAKAKVCARDSGTSVIYNDGAECPPGQSIKVRTLPSGARVKGCFN